MNGLIRRVRGAVGLAVTWAVAWTVIGGLLTGVTWLLFPGDFGPGETVRVIVGLFALLGFLAGLGFAAVLALAERRRLVTQLTPTRGALWGALGAAASHLILGGALSMLVLLVPLGAMLGGVSVALARRALPTPSEPDLLSGGHPPAP